MNQIFIKFIAIFLGILIIISFIAIIYGLYLKQGTSNNYKSEEISLSLGDHENIVDLEPIDGKNILITIKGERLRGVIYNIKNNKIIRNIKR